MLFRLIMAAVMSKLGRDILIDLYKTFFVSDVEKLRREVRIQRQMRKDSAERYTR